MTREELVKVAIRSGWGYQGKPGRRFAQARDDVAALLRHIAYLEAALRSFTCELAPANDVGVGSAQPGAQAGRKGHG